jgi:hypothetical protein
MPFPLAMTAFPSESPADSFAVFAGSLGSHGEMLFSTVGFFLSDAKPHSEKTARRGYYGHAVCTSSRNRLAAAMGIHD